MNNGTAKKVLDLSEEKHFPLILNKEYSGYKVICKNSVFSCVVSNLDNVVNYNVCFVFLFYKY